MFTAEMIAPCGLDCNLCHHALEGDTPCPGCNGPDENKPAFCRESCGIVSCQKRLDHGYWFCDGCPEYPCEDVMEKENRYMSRYPVKESPLQNLKDIRSIGMEAFLLQEKEKWTCRICGSPVCVHTGICSSCGSKKKD